MEDMNGMDIYPSKKGRHLITQRKDFLQQQIKT